jgi:hypothetical protein
MYEASDLPSDDDFDPDYLEESADDDELPPTLGRDRADWVVEYTDALEELYGAFLDTGRQLFGNAFFQTGGITEFSHFCYRYTQPGMNLI